MIDREYCNEKTFVNKCQISNNPNAENFINAISYSKNTIKNFKEDENRNSLLSKNLDLCDIKSEISDGQRIDLDEDTENFFGFSNNGNEFFKLGRRDPQNKKFDFSYEIQLYGHNDFIFDMKEQMSKDLFLFKTQKIRAYPFHMKYTLFQSDEIKALRNKDFAFLYFKFDELKEKGNKMYKRGKFRESIELYIGAYSILKWIDFKDVKKKNYSKVLREQLAILDEDIVEGRCNKFNCMTHAIEEDSYRICIIKLLLSLSYAFMELRHYSNAIHCLNECINYDDSMPDSFFRRAQARIYDRSSDEESLKIALEDLKKAITITPQKIFLEHYDILQNIIISKKRAEIEKLKGTIY